MNFVFFIIFALRCSLLTSCLAMMVNQHSTLMTEKNHSSTIISPLSNGTWNNGGRRGGKKSDKNRKTNKKYGDVGNKIPFLSRDDVEIFKELPLKKREQLKKMIQKSSEKEEYNRKRNLDSSLDQSVLKNRQRRQFLPGKGLLNILNPLGPRSIAANPGLFGSLGTAGLFANKLQRNQASNIIDPSLGLLGGLNPFDSGGGGAGLSSGFGLTGGGPPTSPIGGPPTSPIVGGQDGVSNFFCSIFRYLLGNLIAG
uniref:Uncharacterized protein n=1 Tax=Romanomermis culicivorax TaxID=13658 RepID=A0A915HI73_ROMCU